MSSTSTASQVQHTLPKLSTVPTAFRNFIQKDGKFTPEKDRYHLYVSLSCPWAGRTLIVRRLKGLEDIIGLTIVTPYMTEQGWAFKKADERNIDEVEDDPLYGSSYLREFYFKAKPDYQGRFSVPVLWDKKTETIVNNESSEIIRIFNSAFNDLLPEDKAQVDLYPQELQKEIDEINEWVFRDVNAGVYKVGFASTQEEYDTNIKPLFAALDRLEDILKDKEYLVGGRLTEADVRLFTTLIRFDVAYHGQFKCNIGSIRHNYPNLNRYMKQLYWNNPEFKDTTNFHHIKTGYYSAKFNPTGIVPVGPIPEIEAL